MAYTLQCSGRGSIIYICFFFHRFVCKNNGVLFENDLIQIGVKSEFRQNLGRLGLFYGNKTSFALQVNHIKQELEGCCLGDMKTVLLLGFIS
jgi:hypothetical protein